jgi:hypothetical protein
MSVYGTYTHGNGEKRFVTRTRFPYHRDRTADKNANRMAMVTYRHLHGDGNTKVKLFLHFLL